MSKKTIAELEAANALANTDVFVIDTGTHNYKIPWSLVKSLAAGVTGFQAGSGGSLVLTLSDGSSLSATVHDPTKQDSLTFDSSPTAGSVNPVTSGGTYTALESVRAAVTQAYRYKGSVADYAHLPSGAAAGDVYDVQETGMNYAWNGTAWDALGQLIDIDELLPAITTQEIDQIVFG